MASYSCCYVCEHAYSQFFFTLWVFNLSEGLSETISLPPKIEVRSAYTLPSRDTTGGITLDMLLSFLSIWLTNLVLLSRIENQDYYSADFIDESSILEAAVCQANQRRWVDWKLYSITAKTFCKIYFYVVSVSPRRLWSMRNVDNFHFVSLFKELSYAQGSFSYHVTDGSSGKYAAINWGPRYFIDTQC